MVERTEELLLLPGSHFDPHLDGLEESAKAAARFFRAHLREE